MHIFFNSRNKVEINFIKNCPQEVVQLAGTTLNEAEIISLNHPLPSCVDISKKKKKIKNSCASHMLLKKWTRVIFID
jgi:hypothetical protein